GRLWSFCTDEDDPESYSDNGKAINAYWETPDIDGYVFFKNKTFRYLALKIAPAIFTGVKVFLQIKGIWLKDPIFESGARSRYFSFDYIDFEKLSFSSDRTAKTLTKKLKVKKNDKIRLRFRNDALNEPFGLYSFGLEFEEKNNYRV
ncbi:MAG: hypothetical protein IJS94_05260, partial [Clostridia bacterium]|nr:hypothetical protein [Clostridia bacterium]